MRWAGRAAAAGLSLVGALLGGCGSAPSTLPPAPPPGTPSSAHASASATPSASADAGARIPQALQYAWIAQPRAIRGLDQPAVTALIVMTRSTMGFNANDNGKLVVESRASAPDAHTLRFELQSDGSGCHRGDIGTYRYELSSTGHGLSLELGQDPCVARADALKGSWSRAGACPAGGVCLGDMDAGVHVSAVFTPFEPPSTWREAYG